MLIGDKVKYTEYALRSKRDYWQRCGREPQKSNAKRAYETACAVRGTVTDKLPSGIEVTEDCGTVHRSLDYLWELSADRQTCVGCPDETLRCHEACPTAVIERQRARTKR